MLKMIVTEAVVSRGYDGAPAIRFYDCEGRGQIANFRIGKRVYDKKAEGNHRWLNFNVKAFEAMTERIKQMKLKDGSYINIVARYDEDSWEDKTTHEKRTEPVLYLEEIEYSGGGGQKNGQADSGETAPQSGGSNSVQQPAQPPAAAQTPPAMPESFTGFEGFSGTGNQFF